MAPRAPASTHSASRRRRPQIDFARVHDHVQRVIAAIAPNDSRERFTGLGVRVIEGEARFKDKDTVAVGDDIEIKARRVVIATGSSPAIPAIPGLERVPFLTNETVFDLTACPQHLIVIGAGPIGLELAQAFRRLGAAVTVLEAGDAARARGRRVRAHRARPARARKASCCARASPLRMSKRAERASRSCSAARPVKRATMSASPAAIS